MRLCMKPKQKGETASYKKPNRIFLHYAPKAPSFCHHNPLYIDLSQRKSLYSISSARKPTFNTHYRTKLDIDN